MIQILIVDDEKPICDLIQMSLTRAGYHCMCVYDGLAAADILERNVFDLILLDVMLPKMNGFDICKNLRDSGSTGHPAMLCGLLYFMITSRAEPASAQAGSWRAFRDICIRMGMRHIIAVCPKRYAALAAGRICGENLRIR